MPYCPHCGNETENPVGSAVHETVNAEVEIARLQCERDIEVAKIQARQDRDWNETRVEVAEVEAAAEVAAAEAEAEIIGEIIAAENGEQDPAETAEPIVVQVPDAEPEPEADTEPPPVIETSAPKESKRSGYWGMYR